MVRPSAVTSTAGMPTPRPLLPRLLAGEEERLREHLGLDRGRRDDGHAEQVAVGGRPVRWVDQVVALLAVAPPVTPVAAGGGDRASASARVSVSPAVSTPTRQPSASGRPRAAMSPPASTRQGRPRRGSPRRGRRRSPCRSRRGRGARRARARSCRRAIADAAAAAAGGVLRGAVRRDLLERPVVAGGHERVVDGRVEAASGPRRARRARARPRPAGRRRPRAGPSRFSAESSDSGRKRESNSSSRSNSLSAATSAASVAGPGSAARKSSISVPIARKVRRCHHEVRVIVTGAGSRPCAPTGRPSTPRRAPE